MAKRIGVLEPDDPITSDPALCSTFVSKSVAKSLVRKLLAERIGPRVIKMVRVILARALSIARDASAGFCDGPIGVGNLIPFAKPHSTGARLHYEIPRAGDRSLFARHRRRLIRPSHRVPDEVRAMQAVAAYNARIRPAAC